MKRTPLLRKVAIRRLGTKGREWEQARAKLKVAFERAERTWCELGYTGCTGGMFLGFAHTKKRRNVTDIFRVALACTSCHQRAEALGEKRMEQEIERAIAARETPILL